MLNIILRLGIILLGGLLLAKFLGKIWFPSVTSYLIFGIIIGPSFLNLISSAIINSSNFITNIVLGLIAFGIGENFSIKNLKKNRH